MLEGQPPKEYEYEHIYVHARAHTHTQSIQLCVIVPYDALFEV